MLMISQNIISGPVPNFFLVSNWCTLVYMYSFPRIQIFYNFIFIFSFLSLKFILKVFEPFVFSSVVNILSLNFFLLLDYFSMFSTNGQIIKNDRFDVRRLKDEIEIS